MIRFSIIVLFILSSAFFFISGSEKGQLTPYPFKQPVAFPKMPVSADNPVTEEGALLGRYLFYDTILSKDKTISCASCHKQEFAFSDSPQQFSKGIDDQLQKRNTPPLFNLAWYNFFFWDGRAKTIEEQNNIKKDVMKIYQPLSEYYEKNNTALAFDYYKKYNNVKDSVFNENSNRQITELNTRYETGKKELQLKKQDLVIAKKNLVIATVTGLLLLIGIAGFFYYKKNRLMQEKKLQAAVMKQQDMATKAVIVAEENERKRIAADLHDGIGQMMSAAKMNLSVFESELLFKNDAQRTSFENVIGLIDESCKEIRSVSHQMMPNALLKSGLASAIKEFISRIDNRVIKVSLHTEGLNERIDNNTETVLYRIIQECVNNVLKHAGATLLDISLIKDIDGIAVTIEDNGKGFDSSDKNKFEGIGLKNIISRINYLKGSIDFDSAAGKGTLVAIHVPAA